MCVGWGGGGGGVKGLAGIEWSDQYCWCTSGRLGPGASVIAAKQIKTLLSLSNVMSKLHS